MRAKRNQITPFTTPGYYEVSREGIVSPTKKGLELLAQYYKKKYRCNITLFEGFLQPGEKLTANIKTIQDEITKAKSNNPAGNYRHAFLFGINDGHATPLIYIKEGDLECFLLSDSLGKTKEEAKRIHEQTGITVYFSNDPRQATRNGCYIDALIFCRDTTRINEDGNYYIPDLRNQLHQRKVSNDGSAQVKLPNELLKTAQISKYIIDHKEDTPDPKKIHNDETLEQFRERYTGEIMLYGRPKKVNLYLTKKSQKLAKMIEIQFYLEEIKKQIGSQLTPAMEDLFVREAKAIFKKDPGSNLLAHAEDFLKNFDIKKIIHEINKFDLIKAVHNALCYYIETHGKVGYGFFRNFWRTGLKEAMQARDSLNNALTPKDKLAIAKQISYQILSQGYSVTSGKIVCNHENSRAEFLLRELQFSGLIHNGKIGDLDLPSSLLPRH
jgi:hypothetical protein